MQQELVFKVVMIGASWVGKTSILERFVLQSFTEDYKATIGADFRTKDIEVNGRQIMLQIWDTAGQERFRALATPFYRGANICVLVFDVSQKISFSAIEQWREEFFRQSEIEEESFPFFIVGNKCDLPEMVSRDDVEQWILDRGLANICYLETSAKENINIESLFYQVAHMCLTHYSSSFPTPDFSEVEEVFDEEEEEEEDQPYGEEVNENFKLEKKINEEILSNASSIRDNMRVYDNGQQANACFAFPGNCNLI